MKNYTRKTNGLRFLGFILLILVLLSSGSACGGRGSKSADGAGAGDSATEAPKESGGKIEPTRPVAKFAAPTSMIDATKVAQTESDATPEPKEPDMVYGGVLYTKLCIECHGSALAGVEGKAEPIASYNLDEAGLNDLLRTGGGFGNDHIFGLDKISPEAVFDLQAYLETLGG